MRGTAFFWLGVGALALSAGLARAQGAAPSASKAACEATLGMRSHTARQGLPSGPFRPKPDAGSQLDTCYGLYFGRTEVLDRCVGHGVDFNLPCLGASPNTQYPLRPLDFAILRLDTSAVRALLDGGADPRRADQPLHRLVASCFDPVNTATCREIAGLLVQRGGNLEELGPGVGFRQTPLILAWQMNRPFGHALLEIGANVNGTDNDGCTIYDLANDRRDSAEAAVLVGRGARPGRWCTLNRSARSAKEGLSGLAYFLCIFGGCSTH